MASNSQAEGDKIDIVCGTLQAKLSTKDLSCGTSRCISLGARIFTACEFERHAGKSTSKNWKTSIRFEGKPLSNYLEPYATSKGKRFVTSASSATRVYVTLDTQVTNPTRSVRDFVTPVRTVSDSLPTLPEFKCVSDVTFTWGSIWIRRVSVMLWMLPIRKLCIGGVTLL